MKRTKILTWLTVGVIAFSSCQKEPSANFTTDKDTYVAGEKIITTNKSTNADSYKWTMSDGRTSDYDNVNIETSDDATDGTLTITLEAFSKNGKKNDEYSKTVNIKAATGNVVFWQKSGSVYGTTVVMINGVSSNITSNYSAAPDCGASGCAVFNGLKAGKYNYTASDGDYTWSGSITITAGGCLAWELM